MKTPPFISILLICLSGNLLAQGPPQGPPPDPVAMALDKDHDRKLSPREIRNATKSLLKLDKNKDKALSAEELQPEPPQGRRRRQKGDDAQNPKPPPSVLAKALDTDNSGDLSADEVDDASKSLLEIDSDGDGKLSSEEAGLDQPNSGGPPGGGGQGGGRPPGGPGR